MSRAVETNRHHYLRLKPNSAPRFIIHVIHGKCKEHFTHPILPDALIYFTMLLLFPLHRSLWIFSFRLCYDFFLPFCHVMNQILIHVLFCPFYTWLCRVHWCWFDCLHMLYCFFCFFFVIDVDNKRPICHSHTVLQKQTSETLPSLETVAPQNAAKSIRRPPDLSDDTLMNWTELLCSNWSSFNEVQKRLQPTWTSPTLTLFKWHLYFLLCVNLVRVYSDVFFCFFFCRTHSGYSCLSIDSDWPLYFRH